MRNYLYKLFCIIFLLFFAILLIPERFTASLNAGNRYKYLYEGLPFEMPFIDHPQFPPNEVNLKDYGGIADGMYINTEVFEKAFKALSEKGGGTLIVPSGIWFTGPIVFRSNINLHLEKGALILFSSDFNLYPLVKTVYEGLDTYRCQSPVSGRNLENIAITGEGSINGSGEAWRPLKKDKVTESHWNKVVGAGGVLKDSNYWFPSEKSLLGESLNANTPNGRFSDEDRLSFKDYLRPVMLSFIECKNVLLEGVLFENSPSWNIHPLMCENVIIDNITVRNPAYSQNGDGIDLESCVNSIIVDCVFDVGDDAICIKSGKDEDGRRRARPAVNLIVDNCKVFKGHGGFVVGSEMSGGVRNISVSNCQFLGTDVGLRFKANRGRGGVVENIYINNINMFNIATESFLFDLYYGDKSNPDDIPPVDETTPVFRNIYVKNLISRNAKRAMFFNGLPEMNINNIHVENVVITAVTGAELSELERIKLTNIEIIPETGPALILNNVKDMQVNGFKYPEQLTEAVRITGNKNKTIQLPKAINKNNIVENLK
ncbi:glycoside hydrolase family 28 protein [Dysgonomonas termitidis]|uniref:Glycoside hydrolase family 28 protein n=1 Tax=Dysgonomonas termitidis TaxID=1516126 RepID=A0ABV9KSL9_9BACT